jgi:NAD(P)-dependent dehydrogenase (short-subunit alcohol dehydrogenase family)
MSKTIKFGLRRLISTKPSTRVTPSRTGSLAGHRCIITGASRGIGAAIAYRFAKEGAKCTLIGRHEAALKELSEDLEYPQLEPQHVLKSLLEDGPIPRLEHRVATGDVAERVFWEKLASEEVS